MTNKKKKKIIKKVIVSFIFLLIGGSWAFGIYSLSAMNTSESNGHSTEIISLFIEDTLDVTNKYGITHSNPTAQKIDKASKLLNLPLRKVMHASVYFVLAIYIITFVNFLFDTRKYIIAALITLVLCIGYAASDEYHQTFVEGRTGQVKDVLIDSAGACAGVLLYGTYYIAYRLGYKKCEGELLDDDEIDEDSRERKITQPEIKEEVKTVEPEEPKEEVKEEIEEKEEKVETKEQPKKTTKKKTTKKKSK